MKKRISILAFILLAFGLTACGKNDGKATTGAAVTVQTESSQEKKTENNSSREKDQTTSVATEALTGEESSEKTDNTQQTLVVYFSATGTTRGVAEKIAGITGADIYEIKAAQAYSDADLNWNDSDSRSTKEQNDSSVRPEIGSETISLEGYTKIYIGYPIWWGEEPRIMDTFVESLSFDGIRMIPFCTSSSSGMGRSGKNLAENAGSGEWQDGKRFGAGASEDEIRSWIDSMN